jgi:sulfite reductase alpha subunit-like flavoprotein
MDKRSQQKKVLILYGSETGNCEAISKRIHQEATTKGYSSRWLALNSFREVKKSQCRFFFFVAKVHVLKILENLNENR